MALKRACNQLYKLLFRRSLFGGGFFAAFFGTGFFVAVFLTDLVFSAFFGVAFFDGFAFFLEGVLTFLGVFGFAFGLLSTFAILNRPAIPAEAVIVFFSIPDFRAFLM